MKPNSLIFDKCVPSQLKKTQLWFASILVSPIDEDSRMMPISPSGDHIEEEAFDYIIPSPALRPAQRIQIYHQQYWWRLLSILHDAVPLLTRLFGYHDFNQLIGKPYLSAFPPDTYTLHTLCDHLPLWIEKNYHASDKTLVLDAARADTALNSAFYAKQHKILDIQTTAEEMKKIVKRKMRLQPHTLLLDFRYDLFKFRIEMLKEEVEYWMNHEFPKLAHDRRHYFVLYRNVHNNLNWEEVSRSPINY